MKNEQRSPKEVQAAEIFKATDEAHQQIRPGVCSCGREFFSSGRRSRKMWLTHRIHEEVKLREQAKEEEHLDYGHPEFVAGCPLCEDDKRLNEQVASFGRCRGKIYITPADGKTYERSCQSKATGPDGLCNFHRMSSQVEIENTGTEVDGVNSTWIPSRMETAAKIKTLADAGFTRREIIEAKRIGAVEGLLKNDGTEVDEVQERSEMKSHIEYAGMYVVDSGEHPGCYLISDAPERGCNVAPGATYFESREEALRAIDILKIVDGDGDKFWHLLRAIKGHSVIV